jgi:hypothetical protein
MCCNFTLSDDQKQTIKSTISFLTESFKMLMATLLCIFVPQRCVENVDNICTLTDNFTNLTNFNIVVLVINFITLANFIYLYIVEYKREHWCISILDIDYDKPNTNLKVEINNYPVYKEELVSLNNKYYKITIITLILNICNFILSSILIYGFYYLDYRSVTILLTNVLLIVDKLLSCISISNKSVEELLPISAYMTTPVIFNTIDSDYKKTMELTNITTQPVPTLEPNEQNEQNAQNEQNEQTIQAVEIEPVQKEKITPDVNKLKNKLKLDTVANYLQK